MLAPGVHTERIDSMEQRVSFIPAFDRRSEYGIHCMEVRFTLIGKNGAVTWNYATGIMLPRCIDDLGNPASIKPYGAAMHYHSPKPAYDGQDESGCDLLPGDKCYCDGTYLTDHIAKALVTEGSAAVWSIMQEFFESRFGSID